MSPAEPDYSQLIADALAAEKSGELERAGELLDQAMTGQPRALAPLMQIAATNLRLKRPRRALTALDLAAQSCPDQADPFFQRAQLLNQFGGRKAALKNFERALQIDRSRLEIWMGYGAALSADNQIEKSLAVFQRARRVNPNNTGILSNCGWLLCQLQRYEESLNYLNKALEIAPGHAGARWNRALCLLTMGRFEEGLQDYESRMRIDDHRYERLRNYSAPLWKKGEDIAGKRLFLYTDQGHGDTIQFIRFARDLMRRDAEVIVEVQAPLKELCQTLHPDLTIIAQGEIPPDFDVFCPMPSLPHRLSLTVESIPARVPYLKASERALAFGRERLAGLKGRMKVGLVWAGNPQHFNDLNRSIDLKRFLPLLETSRVSFVSLQKDYRRGDREILRGPNVYEAGHDVQTFMDTAGVISNLDLIISVDTSVAHLAGALGKPVWILLPFSVDFRWLAGRNDSPWYPTARLFRQPAFGDWDSAIEAVRSAVAAALR